MRVGEGYALRREYRTGDICTLDDASRMAFTKQGTVLYDSKIGKIYWSTEQRHAEDIFLDQGEIGGGDVLYLKNSPCTNCTDRLIWCYRLISSKPIIYIGKRWIPHMYRNLNYNAERELSKLIANGFTLNVWESYRNHDRTDMGNFLQQL